MPYRNVRLHPVLRLIYFCFRTIAWIGVGVFFRRRIVLGSEHFRFDGPAIVITNHPSTLMDVFNPGLPVRQEMFFLANYGLFKNPVSNWLLTRLYCIPVKRREDVAEGEARDNNAAFERSFEHLEKNGVLFIAAEGTSWMNRWVREFKTGTARIALGTEARNGWNLGIKIITVGLSYSAPNLFRSDVVVNCGEPVDVKPWAEAWQEDPEKAVDDLTAELQKRVTALTIHTRDEAGEAFITQMEEMLNNERHLTLRESFLRTKHVAETKLDDANLRQKTTQYFDELKNAGVSGLGLRIFAAPNAGIRTFLEGLILIVAFLPFAAGYCFWFLPCYLPWLVNKKLDLYIGYSSTVKIAVGLFTFPLALWAASKWLPALSGLPGAGVAIALSFIALGLFAERYLDLAKKMRERMRARRYAKRHPEKTAAMLRMQQAILDQINA